MPRRRDAVDAAARESPRLANEHDGVKSNAGNGESMVVTTESLLNDKKNIAADSYEKVLLPKVRSTTIRATPSVATGDLLAFPIKTCEGVVAGLSSIIPDARLEILKGGRHDVSLAEVEALAAAVTACAKPSQ